ncbi:MAG: DMT family transporter [Pyrinomonadaceae bacterium]
MGDRQAATLLIHDQHGGRGFAPHLALVAVQIFFGTWPIAGKVALRALPSTGLVTLRIVGATLAFVAILHATRGRRQIERRSDYLRLALFSLLGVVLNQFLFVKGLALSTAVNATLLGTTIPIFTLLASVMLGKERATLRHVSGMLLAAAGVVYLVNPLDAELSGDKKMLGNVLLVANTLCYAAYLALSQDLIRRYGALTVITWVFIFGTLAALPFGGYYLARTPLLDIGADIWFAVLYIIIFPTVGAYYLNAWALGRVAPSTVAIYIYLQPLIAIALAPSLLGERIDPRTWLAAVLIFAGVAAVTLRPRSPVFEEVSERPDAAGH